MRKTAWFLGRLLLPLFFIMVAQGGVAGVVIEEAHKDREGRGSIVLRYFSEDRFRTDHPEGGLTMIIDFKKDWMVMIDHRSKSFVEVKYSQWQREVAKQLKQDLPGIQPRVRKITLTRSGETATINGFQTEKVQIYADGELIEENWVTRDVVVKDLEKVMDKVAQGFLKEFRMEMKEGREIYEKLKAYGFPILVKDYTMTYGLGGINVLEVTRFEKKELKGEVFLPPGGYERVIP